MQHQAFHTFEDITITQRRRVGCRLLLASTDTNFGADQVKCTQVRMLTTC